MSRRIAIVVLMCVVGCDSPDETQALQPEQESPARQASETSDSSDSPNEDKDATGGQVEDEDVADEEESDREVRDDRGDQEEDEPESAVAVVDEPAVVETLCGGRDPCQEIAAFDAGIVDTRSLTVFEVALHDRGEEGRQPNLDDCAPFEYWLVESEEGQMVDHTKLRRLCNDGYGIRRLGEDDVEVADNAFSHHQSGGSNWMWAASDIIQLAPLKVIEEHRSGYWTLGPNRRDQSWDWTGPGGHTEWTAPHCGDQEGELGPGEIPEHGTYHYDQLMQIELDDDFRDGGWRETEFGDCSTLVDSGPRGDDAGGGFVVHGDPGDGDKASFRAVMGSSTELFLEIRDTEWVVGADSWIYDDHVEIWTGPQTDYSMSCLEPDAPSQWGISLFDDAIYPGYNDPLPEALDVQRHLVGGDDPEMIRMKITFESSPDAVTIVYSDTEDGERQERLIATSDLRHGDAASLGAINEISPDDARCDVVDGRLSFDDVRSFDPVPTAY